jgi:hypothetical protein
MDKPQTAQHRFDEAQATFGTMIMLRRESHYIRHVRMTIAARSDISGANSVRQLIFLLI